MIHSHDDAVTMRTSQWMLACLIVVGCFLSMIGCESPQEVIVQDLSEPVLPEQPNILWLVAEDLSPIIPSFGDSTVATPNLSRLAAEGVRFTHAFSPSGVCAPSRAAIATGMYQNHIGAQHMRTSGRAPYFPPDLTPYEAVPPPYVKMHSQYLREAGYYTSNNSKEDYQFRKPVTAWDESSRNAHWRNREPGQPFFSIFNFFSTHESQVFGGGWGRRNDNQRDSLWVDEDLVVPVPPYLPDNEVGQRDVRKVYSNILKMDAEVGVILDELEEDGLLDDTIIFWYADHGGPLPRQKRLLYDSGMRLPLIVRFPDKWRAGEIDDQLVSFVDFMPTLRSLSGIEPPDHVDGRAFLGPYATTPERIYVHGAADRFDEQYDLIRAVRDHRYKYLRNYQPEKPYYLPVAFREQMGIMQELLRMRDAGELNEYQAQWFRPTKDPEELFDTEADPHELHNLAGDPAYAEKLAELSAEMDRWIEEIDDKGLMPETDFIETIWPGQVQPETAPLQASVDGTIVTLTCITEGANIGYQLLSGDEEPGEVWQVYMAPITVSAGQTVVAVAHRIGYKPSEVITVSPKVLAL